MAKGFNCPIIHVNADDVEACVAATRLAMAYREQWGRDVVIDLIGYRRYGHNETDEAAYTQPRMAAQIKEHKPVSELYAERLVSEGVVTAEEVEGEGKDRLGRLQATLKELRAKMEAGEYEDPSSTAMGTGELDRTKSPEVETAVSDKRLRTLNEELLKVPDSFTIHRKLRKPLLSRVEKLEHGRHRIRARRGARVRLAAHRGHPHPAHRPGHRARARSRTATSRCTTRTPACGTCRSRTSPGRWRRLSSTTARSPRPPASGSSTATRPPRPSR